MGEGLALTLETRKSLSILIAVQRADFIVHLNLCPFAKEPMKKGTIRFAISTAENGEQRQIPSIGHLYTC